MKTKYRIILLSVAMLGIASGAVLWRGTSARGGSASHHPFPPVTIPGIPTTGDYCIYRINKTFDGYIATKIYRDSYYQCSGIRESLIHTPTQIALRVYEKPECSHTLGSVPGDLLLEADGGAITQENGFAHFSGNFTLKDGGNGPVVFAGMMELFGRVGTHQALGEQCDETQHAEGWMVGEGQGQWSQYTFRAVISAEASFPEGLINASPKNRITGAIVKAP